MTDQRISLVRGDALIAAYGLLLLARMFARDGALQDAARQARTAVRIYTQLDDGTDTGIESDVQELQKMVDAWEDARPTAGLRDRRGSRPAP